MQYLAHCAYSLTKCKTARCQRSRAKVKGINKIYLNHFPLSAVHNLIVTDSLLATPRGAGEAGRAWAANRRKWTTTKPARSLGDAPFALSHGSAKGCVAQLARTPLAAL